MLRVVLAFAGAAILSAAPKLAVERMSLHQFEDGPVLPSDYEFLPGEAAHFSCRLSGFQLDKSDEDNQRVKLSWSVEVRDPAGILLEKEKSGRIEGRVVEEDKNWLPKFLVEFMIPPFAASGTPTTVVPGAPCSRKRRRAAGSRRASITRASRTPSAI